MPRKTLIRTNDFPYHITTRSNHKWWFDVPMSRVWEIFLQSLDWASKKHPIDFHGAVCMSNHYHMVIQTKGENIDDFMFEFNSHFSRKIRLASKNVNRMMGKRYHWTIIDHPNYYSHVMKYVFRNPVKAGCVKRVEDYPYSTLFYEINKVALPIEILSWINFARPDAIEWLNQAHSSEQNDSIKSGFRRAEFRPGHLAGKRKAPNFPLPEIQKVGGTF